MADTLFWKAPAVAILLIHLRWGRSLAQNGNWLCLDRVARVHALAAVLHGAERIELHQVGLDNTVGTHDVIACVNLLWALGRLLARHYLPAGSTAIVREPAISRSPKAYIFFRVFLVLSMILLLKRRSTLRLEDIKTATLRRSQRGSGAWSAPGGRVVNKVHLGGLGVLGKDANRLSSLSHHAFYFRSSMISIFSKKNIVWFYFSFLFIVFLSSVKSERLK